VIAHLLSRLFILSNSDPKMALSAPTAQNTSP
jgi:hypothetical protein